MKILLDEDSGDGDLVGLLRQAGHDVETSTEADLHGAPDARQFTHAIQSNRILLTRNHEDFRHLHNLIGAAGGHHPGLLVVRFEADRAKNLTPRGTAVAVRKFFASGPPIANEYVVLNHYR